MSSSSSILHTAFRVGDWLAHPLDNTLRRDDSEVRLEPRTMQVLVVLAREPGEVVSKEALLEAVWAGRFVTDDVLVGAVSQLRKALGDEARSPRYIQTVPRRGYRLVAEVAELVADPESPDARPAPTAKVAGRWVVPLLALGFLAVLLLAWARWSGAPKTSAPSLVATAHSDEAVEAYLLGRRLLAEPSSATGRDARHAFERAVATDPSFADAWAGLAESHLRSLGPSESANDRLGAVHDAALRALALDPAQPDALALEALWELSQSWQLERAEEALRIALGHGPRSPLAHGWMAHLLAAQGRFPEALDHAHEASILSPVASLGLVEKIRFAAGDRQVAIDGLRQLSQQHPRALELRWMLCEMLWVEGRRQEAFEELRDVAAARDDVTRVKLIDEAHARGGVEEIFRLQLDLSKVEREQGEAISPVFLARLETALGHFDNAFALLEEAHRARDPEVLLIRTEPLLQPLRDDPRFAEFLQALDLSAP